MVCNDEMCLPPTYEDFSVRVTNAPVPSIWKGLGTTFWLGFLGGFCSADHALYFPDDSIDGKLLHQAI